MPSPFDFDAFTQTATDLASVDLDWKSLPDKTECLAQITNVTGESMDEFVERDPSKWRNPNMLRLNIEWEVRDRELCEEMNMDKLTVNQRILLELSAPPPPKGSGVILWGQNQNQALKDLIKATGLNKEKRFSPTMLRHQMGWVILRNRRPEGFERDITEVAFVRDPEAGRASYEARLNKANGSGA